MIDLNDVFQGPELWKRALQHFKEHPDYTIAQPPKKIEQGRLNKQIRDVEGFLRSPDFESGMDLYEAVHGTDAYMEIFTINAWRNRPERRFSLSRDLGFQRIVLHTDGSIFSAPVGMYEVVEAWMHMSKTSSRTGLAKIIRQQFDELAQPICNRYD